MEAIGRQMAEYGRIYREHPERFENDLTVLRSRNGWFVVRGINSKPPFDEFLTQEEALLRARTLAAIGEAKKITVLNRNLDPSLVEFYENGNLIKAVNNNSVQSGFYS